MNFWTNIVIIIFVVLGLLSIEVVGLYFLFSHFIKPKNSGILIRCLWTLFFATFLSYLLFLSPYEIRTHFIEVTSLWFWILMVVWLIVILAIWLSMIQKDDNNHNQHSLF